MKPEKMAQANWGIIAVLIGLVCLMISPVLPNSQIGFTIAIGASAMMMVGMDNHGNAMREESTSRLIRGAVSLLFIGIVLLALRWETPLGDPISICFRVVGFWSIGWGVIHFIDYQTLLVRNINPPK